jgi:glycosyl transferase family 87
MQPLASVVKRARARLTLRTIAIATAAVIAIAVGFVMIGPASCGFDSSWSVVWSTDLLHLRSAARPAGVPLPTPHPGSLLWGVVLHCIGLLSRPGWAISIDVVAIALFAGIFALALDVAGVAAACVSVASVASLPPIRETANSGTIDMLFAAAVVWSVVLRSRDQRWAAIGFAAFAALCRPEGWLLLCLVIVVNWRSAGLRGRAVMVAVAAAVPAAWLAMGAAMFGGPLAALHITETNGRGASASRGIAGALHATTRSVGWLVVVVLAAIVVGVATRRRLPKQTVMAAVAACLLGIGLLVVIANGRTAVPDRYVDGELALLVTAAIAAVTVAWPHRVARIGAVTGVLVLVVVEFVSVGKTRARQDSAVRAQGRLLDEARHTLAASTSCQTVTMQPSVVLPAAILDAKRPLSPTVSPTHASHECRFVARNDFAITGDGWGLEPPTLQQEFVPAGVTVLATTTDWVLYVE